MMYFSDKSSELHQGDCLAVLPSLPESSIDTVITDPPYGLSFMGKDWDRGVPGVHFWTEILRVAKPGAMLLAFGGTRTFHRLTCAIEDAGWEIRDCMMWLHASGFPKSLDISKAIDKAAGAEREVVGANPNFRANHGTSENKWRVAEGRGPSPQSSPVLTGASTDAAKLWTGWGTSMKPAWEPIIVAMKPLDGTFAENAQRHGVAGLNIDGGRINPGQLVPAGGGLKGGTSSRHEGWRRESHSKGAASESHLDGRFPSNILLDEEAAAILDEQSGVLISAPGVRPRSASKNCYGEHKDTPYLHTGDSGGASRFFYTAKSSASDRGKGNNHPTVKPTKLMKYLCKLTATPTGGVILDPFAGSGTTMVAAREVGRKCIGIELEESHCRIIVDRLAQGVLFGVA